MNKIFKNKISFVFIGAFSVFYIGLIGSFVYMDYESIQLMKNCLQYVPT